MWIWIPSGFIGIVNEETLEEYFDDQKAMGRDQNQGHKGSHEQKLSI